MVQAEARAIGPIYSGFLMGTFSGLLAATGVPNGHRKPSGPELAEEAWGRKQQMAGPVSGSAATVWALPVGFPASVR